MTVVAAEGLDGLTMRAAARAAGCAPMAIYRHVSDRDELVARVVDAICALDETFVAFTSPAGRGSDSGDEGRGRADAAGAAIGDWLMDAATAMRLRLLAHPGVAEHLLLSGPVGPNGLAFMNEVCAALAALGLTPRQIATAYDTLMTMVAVSVVKQLRMAALGVDGPTVRTALDRRAAEYGAKLPFVREIIGQFSSDSDEGFQLRVGGVIAAIVAPGHPLIGPP